MRILFVIFASLLMCSMVGCGDDKAAQEILTPDSETGSAPWPAAWHALSQSEKNLRILQVAIGDVGDTVGRSCKKWVYDVVYSASNGHISVPLNNERGDSWDIEEEDHHTILSHSNRSPALLKTEPGQIVQMQWKAGVGDDDARYNIHTAIVLSVLPNGVFFVESNYDNTPRDETDAKVTIRFESEEAFVEKVQAFSVYYIQ